MQDDKATFDEWAYAESWENRKYDSHGDIQLQVNEIFNELLLVSKSVVQDLTDDVYWELLPFVHRYRLGEAHAAGQEKEKDQAENQARDKAREIALRHICTTERVEVDMDASGEFSTWTQVLVELDDLEKKVVMLYTGNFLDDQNEVRPLTIEEIATHFKTPTAEIDSVVNTATDKIRNRLSQQLIYDRGRDRR